MLELGVAKELGVTLAQLRASASRDELLIWSGYFGILNEDQAAEIERAKKASKGRMR